MVKIKKNYSIIQSKGKVGLSKASLSNVENNDKNHLSFLFIKWEDIIV